MKILFVLMLLLGRIQILSAQNTAGQELKIASENYEKGQYAQAVEYLSLHDNEEEFSKQELQQVYKILISSYHELDDLEKERIYTIKFLEIDPIYKVSYASDPEPFILSLDKYIVAPRWALRLSFGTNTVKINSVQHYYSWDIEGYTSNYTHFFGISLFNPEVIYNLTKQFSVFTGIGINILSFKRNIQARKNLNQTFIENIMEFKFPLNFAYNFEFKKHYGLSLFCGLYVSYSQSSAIISMTNESSINGSSLKTNSSLPISHSFDFPLESFRNQNKFGFTFGANLEYKKSRWTYSLIIQNSIDRVKHNNTDKYAFSTLLTDFNYVEDDFQLTTMNFNFGISYNISYFIKPKY